MSDYGEHPDLRPARVERTDAAIGTLAIGIACVGVTLMLTAGLVRLLYPRSLADQALAPMRAYPDPQLQDDPSRDMAAFAAEQAARVNGAWWIDRGRGIVHQPIEAAMRDAARMGIADWPTAAADPMPRRDDLRHGTLPATSVLRGQQRVVQDSIAPNTDAP